MCTLEGEKHSDEAGDKIRVGGEGEEGGEDRSGEEGGRDVKEENEANDDRDDDGP